MPIKRRGLTEFTFSRFLCPWLCDFKGISIFMDADMLVLCDIYELVEVWDKAAVSVVQNKQRYEWPSLMVFMNGCCQKLTPEYVNSDAKLFDFAWAPSVGALPAMYNHCIGYDIPRADAKIVHYTQGIPIFPETEDSEYRAEWMDEYKTAFSTCSWKEIMGDSVHYEPVMSRYRKRAA